MPMYEFEDIATGARVERFYRMGKAPSIGEVVGGLRRLPPNMGMPAVDNTNLAAAFFAPWQGCDFIKDGRKLHPTEINKMGKEWSSLLESGKVRPVKGPNSAKRYDKHGTPILVGKRQVRDFAKRNGYEWGAD